MNELGNFGYRTQLNLAEILHFYRLLGYFGMEINNETIAAALVVLVRTPLDEAKKVLTDKRNEDTLIRLVNYLFDKTLPNDIMEEVSMMIQQYNKEKPQYIDYSKTILMRLHDNFPEIAKKVNYIPVLINDTYATYAERKAITDSEMFIRNNKSWQMSSTGALTRKINDYYNDTLTTEVWGPDIIKFKYTISSSAGVAAPTSLKIDMLINPIISK